MTTTAEKNHTLATAAAPAYSECGAGGQRQLTIRFSPSNVVMLVGRSTIELQEQTWEYGFTSDTPLDLRFVSNDLLEGWVRPLGSTTMTSLLPSSTGLQFVCARPTSDSQDLEYEFVFGRLPNSGSIAHERPHQHPEPPGKPKDIQATAAQPTLIIRTKKTCPTGLKNPTVEA